MRPNVRVVCSYIHARHVVSKSWCRRTCSSKVSALVQESTYMRGSLLDLVGDPLQDTW